MTNRWFGYELWNGRFTPVVYYDGLPTNGNGKVTVKLKQITKVPPEYMNYDVDQLALKYSYIEEKEYDETFKIS